MKLDMRVKDINNLQAGLDFQNMQSYLLGSKTLRTNVLEFQFVLCWQTMIKTQSLEIGRAHV